MAGNRGWTQDEDTLALAGSDVIGRTTSATYQRRLKLLLLKSEEGNGQEPDDGLDEVKIEKSGAQTVYTASPERQIKSLEDLIEYMDIDTDRFALPKVVFNYWGGQHQVKAWAVDKEPIAIEPVIQPVNVELGFLPEHKVPHRDYRVALILSDTHFGSLRSLRTGKLTPFHDRLALSAALKLAHYLRPDIIIVAGDILDLADWSDKFARSPQMYWTTQPSALEAAWWLAQFKATLNEDGEMVAMPGNHDNRMGLSITNHLKEAYGLRSVDGIEMAPVLSVENLLGFKSLGIDYRDGYPEAEVWINEHMGISHGNVAKSGAGKTATAMLNKGIMQSRGYGHIHKREIVWRKVRSKYNQFKNVCAWSWGCLCRTDGTVPGSTLEQDWQQGGGVVHFDDDYAHPSIAAINDGKLFWSGNQFAGDDLTDQIREDVGWVAL